MKVKKFTALFISLCIVLISFGGCAEQLGIEPTNEDDASKTTETTIAGIDAVEYTLPYFRSDPLNPYSATQETNKNIAKLIYDSLFDVDSNFEAQPVIAEKYTVSTDSITVTIKSGLTFSDNSALTASDVVYSFDKAKFNDNYSTLLKNIRSARADSASSVTFTLNHSNPYEVNNLLFPIIKSGSDKDTTKSDNYSKNIPIGSGRYTMSDGDVKMLVANKRRLGGYHPQYNQIGLKDINDIETISNLFSIGEIDFCTDKFNDGKYTRYSGTTTSQELSNFIYLAINCKTKVLTNSDVRRAIALILDRDSIASSSYAGHCVATSSPFNPSFYALKDCTLPPIKCDTDAGTVLLDEAGFSTISESGIRYSSTGSLSLKMLVNKDNSFKVAMAKSIKDSLSEANINVNIYEYSYSDYLKQIMAGEYDIYLGETDVSYALDLYNFFAYESGLDYGIDTEGKSAKAYTQLRTDNIQMQSFLDTFADDLPFIPICYRRGICIKSDKITTQIKPSVSDCFNNINEWTVK